MEHSSSRFFFDSLSAAAKGLLTVVLDARETPHFYRFGGLSAKQVLASGLLLEGQIESIADRLEQLPGVLRYDE